MIDKTSDLLGKSSLIGGITLRVTKFIETFDWSPYIDLLTFLLLAMGAVYTFYKIKYWIYKSKNEKDKANE